MECLKGGEEKKRSEKESERERERDDEKKKERKSTEKLSRDLAQHSTNPRFYFQEKCWYSLD